MERTPSPLYPNIPPRGRIQIIVPGLNDDEICQGGDCPGCGAEVESNRKLVYCPYCGVMVPCT